MVQSKMNGFYAQVDGDPGGPSPTLYSEISQLVLDTGGVNEAEAQVLLAILTSLEQAAERYGPQKAGEMARDIRLIWLREEPGSLRAELVEDVLSAQAELAPPRARRDLAH